MKALAAILLAALPAVAGDDEVPDAVPGVSVPPLGSSYCYPAQGYCIVAYPDYRDMSRCVSLTPSVIAELKKRVGTVQCARLEVTEPSKQGKS